MIMKPIKMILKAALLLSLVLALSACGTDLAAELQQEATQTAIDPVAIFTAAAATVEAQLTQTAAAFSPTPPPPTETFTPEPTATLVQLDTPVTLPTFTPDPALPTFTPIAGGSVPTLVPTATIVTISNTPAGPICDEMRYGDPLDINYPDGSSVSAGHNFEKIWRIYNTGVCTWDDGYVLVPVSSTSTRSGDNNPLDAATPAFKIGIQSANVEPGGVVDVGAKLTAPLDNGTYTTCFMMQNDRGSYFGGVLCVEIVVKDGK